MPLTDNHDIMLVLAALYESELRAAKFIDSASGQNTDIIDRRAILNMEAIQMGRFLTTQNSFALGEIVPEFFARGDKIVANGPSRLENMDVLASGAKIYIGTPHARDTKYRDK